MIDAASEALAYLKNTPRPTGKGREAEFKWDRLAGACWSELPFIVLFGLLDYLLY